MDVLIFDPYSGASGDMIVSALIDLGADPEVVVDVMESAASVEVDVSTVKKSGISAVRTTVVQQHQKHRTYAEVKQHIQELSITPEIKADVLRVYEILAKAESAVHGHLPETHFHEVGCDDAIADIAGACTAIHILKPKYICCNTISTGTGFVSINHGTYPLPSPATLEILRNTQLVIQQTSIQGELLTPTGAALLTHFTNQHASLPPIAIHRIGYGAGKHEYEHPNLLRAILAEVEDNLMPDAIEVIETNIDDVTGEVLGNLIDRLLEEGAKDVCIIPTTTKKSRSGHIVQVIAKPSNSSHLAKTIIEETGSLGVRIIPAKHRLTARRTIKRIQILINNKQYTSGVKIATDLNRHILDVSAEFDDCKKIAKTTGIPLKHIMRRVEEEGWKQHTRTKTP